MKATFSECFLNKQYFDLCLNETEDICNFSSNHEIMPFPDSGTRVQIVTNNQLHIKAGDSHRVPTAQSPMNMPTVILELDLPVITNIST